MISLGGVVTSTSVRVGGNKFDSAITDYIRRKYNLAIGERTAEDIKINIGSALYLEDKLTMEIRGRDIITGLPRNITVTSDDVTDAIQNELEAVINAAKKVLQETPPELAADILDRGIILTGGGSMLRGLDERLRRETSLPIVISDDPLTCVVRGAGKILDDLEGYQKVLSKTRREYFS